MVGFISDSIGVVRQINLLELQLCAGCNYPSIQVRFGLLTGQRSTRLEYDWKLKRYFRIELYGF